MRKGLNNVLLSLFFVMGILSSKIGMAQSEMTVNVKFELESSKINFATDIQLFISINGKEIQPLMFVNGFVVPDFKGMTVVDVHFLYKGYRYHFNGLPISKFKTDWVFGIVKRPKDRNNKREYYIIFNPKDGRDGTKVTVTE